MAYKIDSVLIYLEKNQQDQKEENDQQYMPGNLNISELTRKQSMPNFLKNKHFLPPDMQTYMCISGGKKCLFFGKFCMLCFLVNSILRLAILPYYRQNGNYF